MQSWKYGKNLRCLNLGCKVVKAASTGLMMSAASFTTHFKTLSNNLLTVPIDLSNLSSACLTDCGAPTIHRNMPSASMEVLLLLDLRP
jgi:hypothetical protein